jgi:glycosyltransferase involved in cell wall biosynthesis
MSTAPTLLAALTLLLWLGIDWDLMRGNRRMKRLATLDAPPPAPWPRVSIVVPARNEGTTVGAAMPTLLSLNYPDYEVIAVDDRSEDDTGAVLDRLAAADARLQVDHVRELPAGWIGKNHALHHGAGRATGPWVLFTDADIHFSPDALRRAVAHAEAQQLDLLAVVPRLSEHGHLLGICVGAFSLLFPMFFRPWRIADPASRSYGGVGAFNLVRVATYRKLGGHTRIRLRPDDDVKLGKLFKRSGARCDFLLGAGAIAVAWYADVREMVRGLTKNAFAGTDYSVLFVLGGVLFQVVFFVWPPVALAVVSGPAWWLNLAATIAMLAGAVDNQRFAGGRRWHGLLMPLGVAVFGYTLLRSMVATLWQRGIVWRGTHYPLAGLKANRL